MKKVLAIMLALVLAFSMATVAFAAETTTKASAEPVVKVCPDCEQPFTDDAEYNKHLTICGLTATEAIVNTCEKCDAQFTDQKLYVEHVAECTVGDEPDYIGLTVHDVLDMLLEYAKSVMEQWDGIESVIIAALDFLKNFDLEGVASIVDSVTGAFQSAGLDTSSGGLAELLEKLVNTVKQWFKDLYEQESETAVVTTEEVVTDATTETPEETAPDTGSVAGTSASIAVFAAVSVAAAAAYVTSKKRA